MVGILGVSIFDVSTCFQQRFVMFVSSGMASVLADSSLTPEQFDYLNTIQESADALLQVIMR
jgi:hypothetical protein